jgi:UDP-glucose 4-epimerase
LATEIIRQLNSNSEIIFKAYNDAYKTGYEDMQRRVPDISKIRAFAGWEPKFNLEDIIRDVRHSLA